MVMDLGIIGTLPVQCIDKDMQNLRLKIFNAEWYLGS